MRWRGDAPRGRHRPGRASVRRFVQLGKLPAEAFGVLVELGNGVFVSEEVLELALKLEGGLRLFAERAHLLAEALDPVGLLLARGKSGGDSSKPASFCSAAMQRSRRASISSERSSSEASDRSWSAAASARRTSGSSAQRRWPDWRSRGRSSRRRRCCDGLSGTSPCVLRNDAGVMDGRNWGLEAGMQRMCPKAETRDGTSGGVGQSGQPAGAAGDRHLHRAGIAPPRAVSARRVVRCESPGRILSCPAQGSRPASPRNREPPEGRPSRRSARVITSRSFARVMPTYSSRRASWISPSSPS